MANCPDDGRALDAEPTGALVCPGCGGAALAESDLEAQVRDALSIETRESSGAFARERRCPSCEAPMAPWRIARMDAWLERCPSCGLYWLERQDRRTVAQLGKRRALSEAVKTLKPSERAELARDLATSAGEYPLELSPVHAALASFGLPVVTRKDGDRTPFGTWALAVALVALFIAGKLFDEGDPLVSVLGYHSAAPTVLSAFSANFAHFGLLHLLGNVYFLLAFGDGVEQRVPTAALVASFAGLGTLAIFLEGAVASGPVLVAGASGGIAALMGACIVLQPRARVVTALRGRIFQLPLWVYGLLELGYQTLMLASGAKGTAWTAHLAGMVMGVALGLAVRV
ncbi:MAG: rhomboid family intramembrane serine protease, partial [Myxococcaceae bacterium]